MHLLVLSQGRLTSLLPDGKRVRKNAFTHHPFFHCDNAAALVAIDYRNIEPRALLQELQIAAAVRLDIRQADQEEVVGNSRVQYRATASGTRYEVPGRTVPGLTSPIPRPARADLPVPRPRRPRHRLRTSLPASQAGQYLSRPRRQKLGIKEVDDGIWLVSFMHYDLGYFDLEQKTLQPLDNPFGTRLSPMS